MTTNKGRPSNQQRFIEAAEITAQKWEQGTHDYDHCKFCEVAIKNFDKPFYCAPCPMANIDGGFGCVKFKSFPIVPRKSLERAKFHREYLIPLIESLPASRFTKKGWKPIDHDYSK